jgi:hypothetical protein
MGKGYVGRGGGKGWRDQSLLLLGYTGNIFTTLYSFCTIL